MSAEAFGFVGNTIRLASGRYLDLADPQPDQFTLADIVAGLTKICRFGGQIDRFYSVAAHSIGCLCVAMDCGYDEEACKAVLMHDAAEAFVGDVVKPLKIMLPAYSEIEDRIAAAIGRKWSIEFDRCGDIVKEIDHAMLIWERKAFFSPDDVEWLGERDAKPITVDLSILQACGPKTLGMMFTDYANGLGICD